MDTSGSLLDQPFIPYFKQWKIDTTLFPMTHLEYPVFLLTFYILSVLYYQPAKNKIADRSSKPKPEATFAQKVVLSLHNLALCIFSVLCFVSTVPVIYNLMANVGWTKASCGLIQKEYDSDFGFWSYLFYLSKYYEFADTFILIWKGRRPIFLQKFHHIGAVVGMWLVITSRSTCGYIFVVFNSFIHSIMYLYYALTVWKIRIPFKSIITMLQMVQFVTGMSLGIVQWVFYGECLTVGDRIVICYHEIYVGCLFILFKLFFNKAYSKKIKKKGD